MEDLSPSFTRPAFGSVSELSTDFAIARLAPYVDLARGGTSHESPMSRSCVYNHFARERSRHKLFLHLETLTRNSESERLAVIRHTVVRVSGVNDHALYDSDSALRFGIVLGTRELTIPSSISYTIS